MTLSSLIASLVPAVSVEVFEAPNGPQRRASCGEHHTTFTVDTSLTRESRVRKPTQRMKGTRASGRGKQKHSVSYVHTMPPGALVNFLSCNEDARFMFKPIEPAPASTSEYTVLDVASMTRLVKHCESASLKA